MRVGIVLRVGPRAGGDDAAPLDRLSAVARAVEAGGFAGLWVTDSWGRGVAQLDALTTLAAMAAVTRTVELGTCILQVSPRNPAELANRAASLAALSGGRLRLGVGPGSTAGDFDVVGADYDGRFRNFEPAIATMRRAWAGEPANRGRLTPWPGVAGPPLLLAAWRNPAWIVRAARSYDGWIASGLRSQWDQLEAACAPTAMPAADVPSSPTCRSSRAASPATTRTPRRPPSCCTRIAPRPGPRCDACATSASTTC